MKKNVATSRFQHLSALIPYIAGVACVGAIFLLFVAASSDEQEVRTGPRILVLYDKEGQFGWLGGIYSAKLENLLGHFDANVTRKTLAKYEPGDLENYDASFYLASAWSELPLPEMFQKDLENTTKPFVWVGINLWRYAWDLKDYKPDARFVERYGYNVIDYSTEKHTKVVYKDTELEKDPFDPGLTRIEITDPLKASIHATCLDENGKAWPYIVQSGNFWFVADMPMISTTFENRSLAFCDLLHDMLGIFHAEQHRAYFRIEDVGPDSQVEALKNLRATLESLKVPFTVSIIPEYRDWSGVYNDGVPMTDRVARNSNLGIEMKRWLDLGAQILQHGTTHQLEGSINPFTGVSGDDYEFYRVSSDEFGYITLLGPLQSDSITNIRRRVNRGRNILMRADLNPDGWVTPNYLASPASYKAFARAYPFACDRAVLFMEDAQGNIQASELNAPFIFRDTYGLKRIPETIGYIDPFGWREIQRPTLPQDLIRRAKALKVVRDGWAGFYFHWYLDPQFLRETVNGLKELDYKFTRLDGGLN